MQTSYWTSGLSNECEEIHEYSDRHISNYHFDLNKKTNVMKGMNQYTRLNILK